MRVFLVAGEASGDALGGALMEGLSALAPGVEFAGVGGAAMTAQGLESLFPMDELSVMGLAEILPRYRQLSRRLHQTVAAVVAEKPDVLLTIDSPDFTLRVARLVRAKDPSIRIVHYVAPTVWAWRPGRARKMAPYVDQVLALYPFEPPFMEAAGMRCDFVGHPVTTLPRADPGAVMALRHDILDGEEGPIVLVLPGSRRSEVTRLGPAFGKALVRLRSTHPGLRALVLAAPSVGDLVVDVAAAWPVPARVIGQNGELRGPLKTSALAAGDVALAASGTVGLELAAAGTPMVIAYDMAWLTMRVMRRMVRVKSIVMINIISGTQAIPEFVGKSACHPEALARALADTLACPEPQLAAMDAAMVQLGRDGPPPGRRAAQAVMDGLSETR